MFPLNNDLNWRHALRSWSVVVATLIVYQPLIGLHGSMIGQHSSPKESEISQITVEVKSNPVDIYYLYNISFNKLTTNLKVCMNNNKRAFADCVYNSEKKWGPISNDDIKSTCCSFWEADECLTQLVLSSCSTNQSTLYIKDEELIFNKKLLQDGYCSSYQQMSDCDFPFWLVVAIIVSLVILFFICGFAVLNNFLRR